MDTNKPKWIGYFFTVPKNKDIKLLAELDGKPLYMYLQKLKTDASQE